MQVKLTVGSPRDIKVDVLAIAVTALSGKRKKLPPALASLDTAAGGVVSQVVKKGDFAGKKGQSIVVYPAGSRLKAQRLLLVGIGDSTLEVDDLRGLGGRVAKGARARQATKIALIVPNTNGIANDAACQALAEGAILADYKYDRFLTNNGKKKPARPRASLSLVYSRLAKPATARAGARRGTILADSQNLARDLSNAPGNAMTPVALAREAVKMGRATGLRTRVMDAAELKRRKMGGIVGVGQGSTNPPRLVTLEHKPRGTAANGPTLCLVGKGITFDSGGISLKPGASMHEMKHDMSGAAAVVGAMRAIGMLKVPVHVVGLIAAAENLPSDTAYRPGDILTMYSGHTVEILNTDAEGRLVLADALAYANRTYKPTAMIDLATLTGACMVALGDWATGLMGTDDDLIEGVKAAGERVNEIAWPLPLFDDHKKLMKGSVSDLKNAGAGRSAGMSTAAGFLAAFVGDTPWVHLDIAGTGWTSRSTAYLGSGATGVGVRMLVDFLENWKPRAKTKRTAARKK